MINHPYNQIKASFKVVTHIPLLHSRRRLCSIFSRHNHLDTAISGMLVIMNIIVASWVMTSDACEELILAKRTTGPPLYVYKNASRTAVKSQWHCSRWCFTTARCEAFFWSDGQCAEVGPTRRISDQSTAAAYIMKKFEDVPLPGESQNLDPFYQHGLTLIPTWISNHIPSKVWDGITYPFPNFNGATVEVWGWISNFIAHLILDVNYLTILGLQLIHVCKRDPKQ